MICLSGPIHTSDNEMVCQNPWGSNMLELQGSFVALMMYLVLEGSTPVCIHFHTHLTGTAGHRLPASIQRSAQYFMIL